MKTSYDMRTCGRCGGTGRMPYRVCAGLCFDCHGTGRRFTPKGLRAYNAYRAALLERNGVDASTLTAGDRVVCEAHSRSLMDANLPAKVRTVESVKVETNRRKADGDADWTVYLSYRLTFAGGKTWTVYQGADGRALVERYDVQGAQEVARATAKRYSGLTLIDA